MVPEPECTSEFWRTCADVPGHRKTPMPPSLPGAPCALRAMTRPRQNNIVLCGFSRGARWVDEVCRNDANLFDFAIAIAPYPQSKCEWNCRKTAREVMQVSRLI